MSSFTLPASSVSSSGGGGFWSGLMGGVSSAFGGGSGGSSSSMWGNIFQGLLGGLGGMASGGSGGGDNMSLADRVAVNQWQSHEARRNIGFAADMEDFYKQKDKVRKRAALDTYGQFSQLSRWAPNYTAAPAVDPGVRPST